MFRASVISSSLIHPNGGFLESIPCGHFPTLPQKSPSEPTVSHGHTMLWSGRRHQPRRWIGKWLFFLLETRRLGGLGAVTIRCAEGIRLSLIFGLNVSVCVLPLWEAKSSERTFRPPSHLETNEGFRGTPTFTPEGGVQNSLSQLKCISVSQQRSGDGATGDCSLRVHSYRATSEMKEHTWSPQHSI